MADNIGEGQGSAGEKAMEVAKDAVNSAAEQVHMVERHFKEKILSAKRPETYLEILKDLTKAAPLGMLAVAFLAGTLLARRR
jgi:hypothetical protein